MNLPQLPSLRTKLAAALASFAALAFSGCVLPIPTSHVVAPSIHGRVIHAHTGAPIDMAAVVVEGHKEASVITSRDGSFHTDQVTHGRPYWVWWPFGGDTAKMVKFQVVRPGFAKHKEKVEWHPKTQQSISLAEPVALKPKSAAEAAEELLKKR